MTEGKHRRPTGLLLAVVLIVIGVAGGASRLAGGDRTPGEELADRLPERAPAAPFSFTYSKGGTRVLDCFMVNLRFGGTVDPATERMALTLDAAPDTVIAVVDEDALLLHRSLFTDPPFTTSWLRLPRAANAAIRAALRRALGADLAAQVTSTSLPPSGVEVTRAALDASDSVKAIGVGVIAGRRADGYRITMDLDDYLEAATRASAPDSTAATTSSAVEATPVFDAWLDDGDDVVRVTVRPREPGGAARPPEESWTTDYRASAAVNIPRVADGDSTTSAAVDLSQLRPARTDCRLGA